MVSTRTGKATTGILGGYTALCLAPIFPLTGESKWWMPTPTNGTPADAFKSVAGYHAHAERLGRDMARGIAFLLKAARQPEPQRLYGLNQARKYAIGFLYVGLNVLATDITFGAYSRTEDLTEHCVSLIFGANTRCEPFV